MGHLACCLALATSIWASDAVFKASSETIEAASLMPFERVSVANPSGVTEIDLVGGAAGRRYALVVGQPSPEAAIQEVTIEIEPASQTRPITVAPPTLNPDWRAVHRAKHAELRERQLLLAGAADPVATAKFAQTRAFHLYVRDGSYRDEQNYRTIRADLVAVGAHALLYVDQDDHPEQFPQATIDEVLDTFDKRVVPKARMLFGRHRDVDRNGKFVILLSHWLGELSGGKVSVGGFVRAGDFFPEIGPPFSNGCDMMYLNSNVEPGAHLRTLLAHEYVHAITLSEHVFSEYQPDAAKMDEEAWLNEAISHLAENEIGEGWSNLDYRISTFLNRTNAYRLVVEDYGRAGLWRCHGSRGSTYLFLRWCTDRFGVGLLQDLVRTNLHGIDNIELACGVPFEDLFRDWSVDTSLAGLLPSDPWGGYTSIDLRNPLETRLLAGARPMPLPSGKTTCPLPPTTFRMAELVIESGRMKRVRVTASSESPIQVTLVRLPDDLPEVRGSAVVRSERTGRMDLTLCVAVQSGSPVRWTHAAIELERLPQEKSPAMERATLVLPAEDLFASPTMNVGQELVSEAIDIREFGTERLVVKLLGEDDAGRRVTLWCDPKTDDPRRSPTATPAELADLLKNAFRR